MALAKDLRPQRRPAFRFELLDGEMLLLHPTQGCILYGNQTATLIWQLCDGQRTIQEIISLLQEAYPESADEMMNDVTAALEAFQSADAITFA